MLDQATLDTTANFMLSCIPCEGGAKWWKETGFAWPETRSYLDERLSTSILAVLSLSNAALAEVEITAQAENTDGDMIEVMVSGESIDGRAAGRPPGLTGVAELTCADGDELSVSIVGSAALFNNLVDVDELSLPLPLLSCPIALFYNGGGRITINMCDTPPTIGGDFVGLSCNGAVAVFGETFGDEVKVELEAEHSCEECP